MSKIIKNQKRTNLRNNEYYDFQSIQDELYAKSLDGETFTDLMSKIISGNNILLAYRNIKKNTGSNTKGTDGKTIAHLARLQPDELVKLVTRVNILMERRVRRKSHARCEWGENLEIVSKGYLSISERS